MWVCAWIQQDRKISTLVLLVPADAFAPVDMLASVLQPFASPEYLDHDGLAVYWYACWDLRLNPWISEGLRGNLVCVIAADAKVTAGIAIVAARIVSEHCVPANACVHMQFQHHVAWRSQQDHPPTHRAAHHRSTKQHRPINIRIKLAQCYMTHTVKTLNKTLVR